LQNKSRKVIKKQSLHPRNLHNKRYPIADLVKVCPELKSYVKLTPQGETSIDFSQAKAVFLLNKALLSYYYQIQYWQIPENFLCPPVPGRADYLHYLADLITGSTPKQKINKDANVRILDIGTGANCIYPLIGESLFGWQFVGTDISKLALESAEKNLSTNHLSSRLVWQKNKSNIFKGILKTQLTSDIAQFDACICNPPFYESAKQAMQVNLTKQHKLNKNRVKKGNRVKPIEQNRNFRGQNAELWCQGGELAFLLNMVDESIEYAKQIVWFTTLVSNKENLPPLQKRLAHHNARQVKTIPMGQGQKQSRILAWQF